MLSYLQTLSYMQLFGIAFGYVFLRGIFYCSFLFLLLRFSKGRRLISEPLLKEGQLRSELMANIRVNLVDSFVMSAVIYFGWAKDHPFSIPAFLGSFFFCYIMYDFWFYCFHRLQHTPLFWPLHLQHHKSRVTTPLSALSMSMGEKLINVTGMFVVPCLLTYVFPLVFEGIVAYHIYNFAVNALGHSNMEILPKNYEKTLPGRMLTTATYHSMHHLKGKNNYGLFMSIFDKIFSTYDREYPELFRKVTRT